MPVSSVGARRRPDARRLTKGAAITPPAPERAQQVAVAAGPGAESLVRDEHERDRLGAVDERHAEQERRRGSGRPPTG